MPNRKKTAREMNDVELEKRIFPKRVLDELKRVAHEQPEKQKQQKKK